MSKLVSFLLRRACQSLSKKTNPENRSQESPKDKELDSVDAKLAALNVDSDADRMAQLDNPFDDEDDEEDSHFDLNDYTEEEIG